MCVGQLVQDKTNQATPCSSLLLLKERAVHPIFAAFHHLLQSHPHPNLLCRVSCTWELLGGCGGGAASGAIL